MKHHKYNPGFKFVVDPIEFNKYTDRDVLKYCLGATMYMPGTKDFASKIITGALSGLSSIVMCFEDACPSEDVEKAEENVVHMLETLGDALDCDKIIYEQIPLIFCRVRSVEQFKRFSEKLNKQHLKMLCGINFPKFNTSNAKEYFSHLKTMNMQHDEVIYGMPIIEDTAVAFKETRMNELLGIKDILNEYHDLVLQIRVGATDFSSCFGVRRGVDYTIYDILTVRECLTDILNVFSRNSDYVISGPVWEYFRASKDMMFKDLPKYDVEDCLLKRIPIVNEEIDGLLREVIIDKANGFIGRTVIHPTHIKYVNSMQAVTKEEYDDAVQILKTSEGVVKSVTANKMNEIKPHTSWAEKTCMRAKAYGVIENEMDYIKLFSVDELGPKI